MKLLVTIDTEEDTWDHFSPSGHSVNNIEQIPALQEILDDFGVRPTYLVTYPIATDETSVSILKYILDTERCEIGTHCHPWNTPPFVEEMNDRQSMLCNLSPELQYMKLQSLHSVIMKNFGIQPVSFRAGRWGFNHDVAKTLHMLGYRVDTSISPYMDWTKDYGPDFSLMSPRPYGFSIFDVFHESGSHDMWEVPATIGFFQSRFSLCSLIDRVARKTRLFRYMRLSGLLARLRLLNKVWLSPEFSDSRTMIKLAQLMSRNNYPLLNLVFHSSVLLEGGSAGRNLGVQSQVIFPRLREFLTYCRDNGMHSITLCEVENVLS